MDVIIVNAKPVKSNNVHYAYNNVTQLKKQIMKLILNVTLISYVLIAFLYAYNVRISFALNV